MGYEYDFVFDWMVKKQNPSATLKTEEDKKEEEKQAPTGGAPVWTESYIAHNFVKSLI